MRRRAGWRLGTAGVAGLELALMSPILILLTIMAVDFCGALSSRAQIARALANAAEYATLAGQNSVAQTTIAANARTLAGTVANGFVGTPTTTAVVNNGVAGSKCCIGASWNCSTTLTTCGDGSSPGVYITITASYAFTPLFPSDTTLAGKTLTDSITAPLQ